MSSQHINTSFFSPFLPKISAVAFLLFAGTSAHAQSGILKGSVMTADHKPAISIRVVVKETGKTAATDENGSYKFGRLAVGMYHVEAKGVGFESKTQEVQIEAGQVAPLDFELKEDNKTLQEVTVSAGYNKFARKQTDGIAKMPLHNMENPQVYNVVPKELLQDQVIVSYNDVLKNVTGVSQSLVNGSNSFNLRGFFTTSYLRNGLQDAKQNSIEVANIERIEVLKGPSATLFGSSLTSFGGLLNRVTKQPYETFGGEVLYTAGGYGLSRVTLDVNTPLSKEKGLYMRTNAAYDNEGSFQDAGFTKRFFISPSLLYKPNDRVTVLLDAEIYSQKSNDFNRLFPQLSFTKTNPRDLGIDWTKSYSSNDLYETKPSVSVYGKVDYKLSDNWHSQTSFSQTNSSAEGYYSWNSILGDTVVSRNPGYEHSIYRYTELQQNFNGDFKVAGMRNRVVLGLDYLANTTTSTSATIYGFDEVSIQGHDPRYNELTPTSLAAALSDVPYSNSAATQNTYSAYVSDVLNITDNITAMASVRVDHFVNRGTHNINNDTTTGQYKQTALSPKFGLVYQILPRKISLFGNYMNGFSNNAPSAQPDGTLTTFKPSQANQWEAGVKFDLFNGRLSSTLSYYHIKVSDVIHADLTPGHSGYQVQDGGQLSKGFEAEVIANPFKGFNLIAGYAYNDIYAINTNPDRDGLHQWTGPAQMANLWLSYHFFNNALKGVGIGIGGNYNGKAYIGQSVSQGEFYIPEYTVLNAVLSYQHSFYRVALKLDNLTNEVYWGSYVSQMMPRRFSATVAVKF
ncbi:TonB-dependent receptor [Taibaiella soli]|uniref:TonB-dependent siderophore receptor n=1 Tax=Taibaiella soli TaxID=1649169 RepID=A0A2W2ASS0_9BACT|nr:TonB-dependent receptor [Taibaiella soli]PZF70994.1 TonB-dependent siderophore receptor [Taibaiella soli]